MNIKLNKSDTAQQIRTRELLDTKLTDAWLEQQGINAKNFSSIHIKLLQAQSQAKLLTENHQHLLTNSQLKLLIDFLGKMKDTASRSRLKPAAALPILNLAGKINRQLFKAHRQATRSHKGNEGTYSR